MFAETEILTVITEDELTFQGDVMVMKRGSTSGTTLGRLKDNSFSFKVDESVSSKGYFTFFNCYAIEDINEDQPFFIDGDSGSGVFVVGKKGPIPLGIAFAYMKSYTAVCKIDRIVDELGLNIVQYDDEETRETLGTQHDAESFV